MAWADSWLSMSPRQFCRHRWPAIVATTEVGGNSSPHRLAKNSHSCSRSTTRSMLPTNTVRATSSRSSMLRGR